MNSGLTKIKNSYHIKNIGIELDKIKTIKKISVPNFHIIPIKKLDIKK